MDPPWPDGQEGYGSSSYGLVSPDLLRRKHRGGPGNLAKRKVFALLISVAALAAVWQTSSSSSAASSPESESSESLDVAGSGSDDTWFFGTGLSTLAMDETKVKFQGMEMGRKPLHRSTGDVDSVTPSVKFEQMGLTTPKWFMKMGSRGATAMPTASSIQLAGAGDRCGMHATCRAFLDSPGNAWNANSKRWVEPQAKTECDKAGCVWTPCGDSSCASPARCGRVKDSAPLIDQKNKCQNDPGCIWNDATDACLVDKQKEKVLEPDDLEQPDDPEQPVLEPDDPEQPENKQKETAPSPVLDSTACVQILCEEDPPITDNGASWRNYLQSLEREEEEQQQQQKEQNALETEQENAQTETETETETEPEGKTQELTCDAFSTTTGSRHQECEKAGCVWIDGKIHGGTCADKTQLAKLNELLGFPCKKCEKIDKRVCEECQLQEKRLADNGMRCEWEAKWTSPESEGPEACTIMIPTQSNALSSQVRQ